MTQLEKMDILILFGGYPEMCASVIHSQFHGTLGQVLLKLKAKNEKKIKKKSVIVNERLFLFSRQCF